MGVELVSVGVDSRPAAKSRRQFLVLWLGFTLLGLGACAIPSDGLPVAGLPNFHRVSEKLYRGAQPNDAGIRSLAALGIKTVVNLRAEGDGWTGEAEAARAAGLNYYNVPLPGISRPSDEQVNRVLALIATAEPPVFVHCRRGADRTGTIIACYRIANEGWDANRALAEAKQHGMAWGEFGMKDYIQNFHAPATK